MKRALQALFGATILLLVSVLPAFTQASTITAVNTECTSVYVEINNTTALPKLVNVSAVTADSGISVINLGTTVTFPALMRSGVRVPFNVTSTSDVIVTVDGGGLYSKQTLDCTNEILPLNRRDNNRPFRVFCDASGGVNLLRLDGSGNAVEGVQATVGQLAGALIAAANNSVNTQAVSSGTGLSIWGLTSGQVQAVYRGGLGDYDFVFPVTNCGGIDISRPINTMMATLIASPVLTPALPSTTTTTTTTTVVTSTGVGGACAPIAPNTRAHVVQSGQTLFRIGQAYGVPFSTIAAVNAISNPNRIFAGQCLQIP